MFTRPHGVAAFAIAAATFLAGCTGDRGSTPTVIATPRDSCLALANLVLPQTSLVPEYVEDGTTRPPGLTAGDFLPAHCIVRGAIEPRVGADGRKYEIRFELRLPTAWSGRFMYQGGGGNDGVVRPAVGRNTGSLADAAPALARGFAVVTTDAGHQGPGPEFGLDPVARVDNAYAAHDRTAVTAKEIIRRQYGRGPDKSYFAGCSGGGRQGMMFAQRYPGHFDGIIASAPAMSVSSGATIAAAWDTIIYTGIAPADAGGRKILSKAFSNSDLNLVASGILAACDAKDGIADGMVQNVGACRFDPNALKCRGAKDDNCLSAAQVGALAKAFAGPKTAGGQPLYAGQPWDPGISAPAWRAWKLGTSETPEPNANNAVLMAGALAYYFITPPDPKLNILAFDFESDPARMQAHSQMFDTYRDDRLQAYRQRGGKLLFFHGVADGIFSASESIDYYNRLAANNGGLAATQLFSRLFLVPGMNHCSGGPATDSYDGLAAIVEWVEKGNPPERIIASAQATNRYFPNRTRPLCAYPQYAKYRGSGSVEEAASFVCAND